jgi:hypothetical protein
VPTKFTPVAGEFNIVTPEVDHVKLVMPQLSPVVGLVVAIVAKDWLGLAGEVMLAGHAMVGKILSTGVIVNAQREEFPCTSHT